MVKKPAVPSCVVVGVGVVKLAGAVSCGKAAQKFVLAMRLPMATTPAGPGVGTCGIGGIAITGSPPWIP